MICGGAGSGSAGGISGIGATGVGGIAKPVLVDKGPGGDAYACSVHVEQEMATCSISEAKSLPMGVLEVASNRVAPFCVSIETIDSGVMLR